MEKATYARFQLAGRTVTLVVNGDQLLARAEGDLITAEIVSVEYGALQHAP